MSCRLGIVILVLWCLYHHSAANDDISYGGEGCYGGVGNGGEEGNSSIQFTLVECLQRGCWQGSVSNTICYNDKTNDDLHVYVIWVIIIRN